MKKIYLAHSTQDDNMGVDGITEENRMTDFGKLVKKYLIAGSADLTIFENTNNQNLMDYIEDSNNKKVDLHIELHSNAGSSNARGFEIYYSNYPILSQESKNLATCIFKYVSNLTEIDRGIFADTNCYDIGLAATRETSAVAVLLEMFFHTNFKDINEFNLKKEELARAIAIGIYDYLELTYANNTKNMSEILKECTYTPDLWETKLRSIPNSESMIKKVYYHNKNQK